ncbi:MAG: AMP-binding protein [Acidimicrobiia bacterium]|nr:AMP-binding protein [Acidimicrobiia bacterium]
MTDNTTLLPRLAAAATRPASITFVTGAVDGPGYDTEEVAWSVLHDDARAMAAALHERGAGPGTTVGILGPTSRDLVTAIRATWLAGATVAMLPLPMRLGSMDEFIDATRNRIENAEIGTVLVDPLLQEFIPDDIASTPFSDLGGRSPADYREPTIDPDSLAILQFTSGSTSDPKGVMLPHRCVTANIDAIAAGSGLDPTTDRVASWLPLYHDMGLIGLLGVPMTTGVDLVLAGPQDFLAAPLRWMEWMSRFRCTLTGGPNFSYALAARAMRRATDLDLSAWRLALNGAEPIDPDAVEAFLEAGAKFGLDPRVPFCVYGMAEATLAISFPAPGTGLQVDTVDRRVLETDQYATPVATDAPNARRLPKLGHVLDGLELRIVDPDTGAARAEREVGEIELRGNSITPGYFKNPAATAAAITDGWLRTGDLGYLVDDEVVICGRRKDVIIVGGRNVFPEDVERAAARATGVRAGNVIAFGATGRRNRESIVIVAETRAAGEDADPLRTDIIEHVTHAIGIPPGEVVLVSPGTLPKTSSGKLQRSLCRARYLDDIIEPV